MAQFLSSIAALLTSLLIAGNATCSQVERTRPADEITLERTTGYAVSHPATRSGSVEAQAKANEKAEEILIQRIQAGDSAAIAEVGKSGNQLFLPYLNQILATRTTKGEGFRHYWPEELALARLGQRQQLQEFWCSAIVDDPKHGLTPTVEQFDLIGGWFSVQALEKFLTPDGLIHWHKPTRQEKESDTADLPVQDPGVANSSQACPGPSSRAPT